MPTITMPTGRIGHVLPTMVPSTADVDRPDRVEFEVWVVEPDQTRVRQILGGDAEPGVVITNDISESLGDQPPSASIEVAKTLQDVIADIQVIARELQIVLNGRVLAQGPVITKDAAGSSGVRAFGMLGADWYFVKRIREQLDVLFGNYLMNADFAAGLFRWNPTDGAELDTDVFYDTPPSVHLPDGATISQSVYALVGITSENVKVVLEVQVRLDADVGPGLFIELSAPGTHGGDHYKRYDLIAEAPREQWFTVRLPMTLDANNGNTITTKLRNPGGGSMWAAKPRLALASLENTGVDADVPEPPADMATLIADIVHATNDGLFISVDAPPTFRLAEPDKATTVVAHDALSALTGRDGAPELAVIPTVAAKVLRVFSPRRGRDIPADEVTLCSTEGGPDGRGTAADWTWGLAGDGAVTDAVVQGENGTLGHATNSSWGGRKMQAVVTAPTGTPDSELDGVGNVALNTPDMLTVITFERVISQYVNKVLLGDRAWVLIDDFEIQVWSPWRVIDRKVHTDGTFDVVLNWEPS